MPDEYSKEELWKLYEDLPNDLKKAIFSEETANSIYNTCLRNKIEEKVSEVAKYVGYVLLGLLSPSEFEKTLIEKLQIEKDTAKKIFNDITHFVFFPVKDSLEVLYTTKIETGEQNEEIAKKGFPEKKVQKDIYREPIE